MADSSNSAVNTDSFSEREVVLCKRETTNPDEYASASHESEHGTSIVPVTVTRHRAPLTE
jgi:hypothetical protein